jgi:hypothetical protein
MVLSPKTALRCDECLACQRCTAPLTSAQTRLRTPTQQCHRPVREELAGSGMTDRFWRELGGSGRDWPILAGARQASRRPGSPGTATPGEQHRHDDR